MAAAATTAERRDPNRPTTMPLTDDPTSEPTPPRARVRPNVARSISSRSRISGRRGSQLPTTTPLMKKSRATPMTALFVLVSAGSPGQAGNAASAAPATQRQPLPPQGTTLLLGGAPPDPGALIRLQCIFETLGGDGAAHADVTRTFDGLPVGFAHGEEE